MKRYIKQRVFSIGDKYDVYDEFQQPVYQVQGELLTFMAKLHLCDPAGRELFFIARKLTMFLARYEIYSPGGLCATVQQELSFLRPRLTVESAYGTFQLEGDFLGMQFCIYCNGRLLGSVQKRWLSWGDTYEMDIASDCDPAFFCALVIAIDNCVHNGSDG